MCELFGEVTRQSPLFHSSAHRKNRRLQSVDNKYVKLRVLRGSCNSGITQPFEATPGGEPQDASQDCGDPDQILRNNRRRLANYGERYRAGLPISSSTAESTVNCVIGHRFVGRGHMRCSPQDAHPLLQIRCAVLNREYAGHFRRWYARDGVANDVRYKQPA
jgi:hypothetical protein